MWIELTILSLGALSYAARRHRSALTQKNLTLTTRRSAQFKQFWHIVSGTNQANRQSQLHSTVNPVAQQQLQTERELAAKQQKFGLYALGLAISGTYFPALKLISTAAVLYLMWDTLKLIRNDFQRGRYFTFYLFSLAMTCWTLASGNLIFATFSAIFSGFFARIVNRLEQNSYNQLVDVFADRPKQVWIIAEDTEIQIPYQDLQVGQQVVVRPGEAIPIDGTITAGHGLVDQHVLSGESQPAEKIPGDEVFAATLLLSGELRITVKTTHSDTLAANISKALNKTQHYKDSLTTRGRQISDRYLPVSVGLTALTFPILGTQSALAISWVNFGGSMATLGPLGVMSYLQILSSHNILVKDGRVFELLRDVDTVVFDKTGTLTLDQPTVHSIQPLGYYTETQILRYAAIAEYRQSHPVAKAILAKAAAEQLELPIPDTTNYSLGYGIQVNYQGKCIQVGSARFLQQQGIALPDTMQSLQPASDEQGHTLIYIAVNQEMAGIIVLQSTPRPEAFEVVQFLQQRNIQLYIISGDHIGPTRSLAKSLGIQNYFANVLPEHKADYVNQLKAQGRFVCFVGDGINDAIALKTAQVSLSLSGASSAATDTAQIVLTDGKLTKIPELFQLSDKFERTMQKNLMLSFIPGCLIIPGVFFFNIGPMLSMSISYFISFIGLGNIVWSLMKYQDTPEISNKLSHLK
jgi:Cu2+-exporting ATPase